IRHFCAHRQGQGRHQAQIRPQPRPALPPLEVRRSPGHQSHARRSLRIPATLRTKSRPQMSTTSKAAAIAAAIAARLATITRANGYHTNAGLHVWRGRTAIDADELPSITLFEQEDQVEDQ